MYGLFIFILVVIILITLFLIVSVPIATTHTTLHRHINPHLYDSEFVEDAFKPVCDVDDYWRRVNDGKRIMKNKTLTICGLAWNIAPMAQMVVKRLKYLSQYWSGTVHWIIIASDSTDDTVEILKTETKNLANVQLHLPVFEKPTGTRMHKMAKLRNVYLHKLTELSSDYVLVMDLDLEGPLSVDGLANSLHYIDGGEYAVLTANGLFNYTGLPITFPILGYTYYDSFAVDSEYSKVPARVSKIYYRGQAIIPVKSAFGGAALYNAEILQKYRHAEDVDICEHIDLHGKMYDDGYKVGINPSMILLAGLQGVTTEQTEHYIQ